MGRSSPDPLRSGAADPAEGPGGSSSGMGSVSNICLILDQVSDRTQGLLMTGFAQPGWVRLRPRKSRDVQAHSATLGAVRYDPFAAAHQTLDPYRHRVAEVYDRARRSGWRLGRG